MSLVDGDGDDADDELKSEHPAGLPANAKVLALPLSWNNRGAYRRAAINDDDFRLRAAHRRAANIVC